MELGQAILLNASESLGTPASIGWLTRVIHPTHAGQGNNLTIRYPHREYPDGLFEVWVCDSTGDAGEVLTDLAGRIYAGPPGREGIYCYWP